MAKPKHNRFTAAAVALLRGLREFVRAVEGLVVDVVSLFVPWLSPLLPAWMGYDHLMNVLFMPAWVAVAGALVIEALGLGTINTIFELWSYNAEKNKSNPRAPVFLAILTAGYYLAVVLVVNAMLDDVPTLHRVAKALLSSLSVVGGVTIALRASHARRLDQIQTERTERRQARKERTQADKVDPLAMAINGRPANPTRARAGR